MHSNLANRMADCSTGQSAVCDSKNQSLEAFVAASQSSCPPKCFTFSYCAWLVNSHIPILSPHNEKLEDKERLPFAWNFRVGFLGQMEQFISSGKNGSKYDAVPFVKNDPVELSRLVRFLQMVQLIPVISVETKKEEYLRMYSFYSGKFSPGWTVPFDISSEKNGFSVQIVLPKFS